MPVPVGVIASARRNVSGGGALLTHTATTTPQSLSTPTLTWTAVPIGTPSPTRTVVVAIVAGGNVGLIRYPTAVTIGGVATTNDIGGNDARPVIIRRATVPSGATADIALTWNASASGYQVALFVFAAASALSVVATNTQFSGSTPDPVSVSLASAASGYLIAAASSTFADSPAWTGDPTATLSASSSLSFAAHGPTSGGTVTATLTPTISNSLRLAAVTYQGA